ncbi:N-acetylglucosaminyldiphosphoundecaprenol N-acetyl-beta-D-mannosaminyltransferase [Bosea sp. 124]|nr:N-acetylglucosaminyldiphosphoundecaprenol N-acetyl-beta-D-mannosaminyltransferase [Bosea sp. 124]
MTGQLRSSPMFGITFSCESTHEIADELCGPVLPKGAGLKHLVTMNVDHVVNLRRNAAFRQAYRNAWKATIDGMPILLYARLRRIGIKERVTGASLFPIVFQRLDASRHKPFIVAPSERTAEILRTRLVEAGFDSSQFALHVPEFGFESDPAASELLVAQISALQATHIIFGVGAPKSEIWIDRHRHALGDAYCLSVGAALDFHAGTFRRAPHWMQQVGLEWLWRFGQQPRRMFRRYFVDSRLVFGAIVNDLRHGGTREPEMTKP